MKKSILLLFLLLQLLNLWGQADISMATQSYNRANYNPASIARPDYIYLFSNARSQWNGIKGAPQTLNVQASGFMSKYNSAVGLSLVSDNIGMVKMINPLLSYAYQINNSAWSLSFGLSGGIFHRYIDNSLFNPKDIYDPILNVYLEKLLKPDANVGIEFQSNSFIFGASSTHLFSIFDKNATYLNTNHQYGYVVYKNTNSGFANLYTGLQVTNRSNLTVFDINATVRFKHPTGLASGDIEIFDLGFSYRTSKQITALLGVNISPNFRIGYAFDQSLIVGYNQNGTHEIMLEYRIPSKNAVCKACLGNKYWYR